MTSLIIGVALASVAWFVCAAILFFNPVVDPIYRSEEAHPAVKSLPQVPATIGKIFLAVVVQCVLWAVVYVAIADALGSSPTTRALLFGSVITAVKILPRDIDRILLTTYPPKRLTIEFIVGVVCAYVVGFAFAFTM